MLKLFQLIMQAVLDCIVGDVKIGWETMYIMVCNQINEVHFPLMKSSDIRV